jgi:signal transduction histidine kinase
VLENLVANALKYAPGDSPVVVGGAAEAEWLVAWVDDEGIGVPESERSLVTEPFHRAWNVRESRIAGTGLGLYICRRLVEAHGGRLSIGDRPDARPGSHVVFTLPILRDGRRPARAPETAVTNRG